MNKKEMIRRLKKWASNFIETDLIDFEALVDETLSYQENKEIIANEIKKLKPNAFIKMEDIKAIAETNEMIYNEYVNEQMRIEFENALEEIKKKQTPELEKYFMELKEMVKAVVKTNLNGLIVYGPAGWGKSFQVLTTLHEMGLKEKEDYVYISTHTAPLELYNTLYKFRDRIVILDDVERLLENLTTLGILKSALWSPVGKRYVYWYSTTDKLEAPPQFEFTGKIIILMNRIPDNRYKEIVDSLLSRVLVYKLEFDYETKIKAIYEFAKVVEIPLDIVDFVRENVSETSKKLNFRTLIQLKEIYQYYNGIDEWKKIAKKMLEDDEEDEIMKIVYEIIQKPIPVKEQVREFIERTGMSRRTFFYIKKKVKMKMGGKV